MSIKQLRIQNMMAILKLAEEYRKTAKQIGISLRELENIVRFRHPDKLQTIEDSFAIAADLEEDEETTLRCIFDTIENVRKGE